MPLLANRAAAAAGKARTAVISRCASTSSSPQEQPTSSSTTTPPPNGPQRTRRHAKKPKSNSLTSLIEVDSTPGRHRTQYNTDPFTLEPTEEHYQLPLVTAQDLAASSTRPQSVRMLARDFIHDSLYNPAYGYFSRHAVLLPDGGNDPANMISGTWDFAKFKNDREFAAAVQARYDDFEQSLIPRHEEEAEAARRGTKKRLPAYHTKEGYELVQAQGRAAYEKSRQQGQEHDSDVQSMVARQVWHTPTELFKPHYANIIAQHCLDTRPSDTDPLVVYELGAGSGSLAEAFLSYLEERNPEIYETTQYNIVEISERLSQQQRKRLARHEQAGRLKVHNKDFLQWNQRVEDNCVVIGLEVLDNLTHDVVRYSTADLQPYQTYVSIDSTGDMHELYVPATDPLILRYLDLYKAARPSSARMPPTGPGYLNFIPQGMRAGFTEKFPFYPNLTPPHYIPTGSLQLLDVLRDYFPRHRLVLSDFHSLPNALEGVNAPVVQTRFQGTMIPVTKYTVLQGFFDIFFPTDFALLRDIHGRNGNVFSHRKFLERYPELNKECNLKDGSNPMLGWYQNASWLIS